MAGLVKQNMQQVPAPEEEALQKQPSAPPANQAAGPAANEQPTPANPDEDGGTEDPSYDKIIAAAGELLYGKGKQTVLQTLQQLAQDPPKALATVTFTVMETIDSQMSEQETEGLILPASEEVLELIGELANAAGIFPVDEQVLQQAADELMSMAVEAGILDPALIESEMNAMDPAQLQQLVQSRGGA